MIDEAQMPAREELPDEVADLVDYPSYRIHRP
jgi:hypothetical protein